MAKFEDTVHYCPFCNKPHVVSRFTYKEKNPAQSGNTEKTGYYCSESDGYFVLADKKQAKYEMY